MILPTLSVRQPWAYAMFHYGKDIENRNWYTGVRGPVLIHASLTIDYEGILFLKRMGYNPPKDYNIGGITGIVNIVDCVRESKSKWFFGEFGFVLKDQKELPFVPCRGKLGFFKFDYNFEIEQYKPMANNE